MQVSVGAPVEYTTVGSVVSDQRIDVTTRLSGYIRAVLVQEGDRVRRGQVLVRLDTSDVEASIRQAQAGVSAAEAAFRDAEVDRGHFQQLFEHGTISDNEFRKVVLKDEAAHETLKQARAALDMACAQREYAAIKSPVDGTVVARSKLVGDLAVPGVPILTLESEYGLLFEAFVDVGVDKESLAAPTPFIRSWTPSGRRPKSPSIRNRGAELGTTRTDHPGLLGDEPGFRIAKTYGGVAASFVSQKGQKVVSRTNFLK
jgi:multidrug efflux pump subunit AcrA (membrane-fusion protein)